MALALWRYDEHGARLRPGHFSTRLGRRQNALLAVREDTNNALLNPFFLRDGRFWTRDTGMLVKSKTPKGLPFGTGALELSRDDGLTTAIYINQQQLSGVPAYHSNGTIDWSIPPDGSLKGYLSVYAKGPKGAKVALRFQEVAAFGWAGGQTFTLTKSFQWERFTFEFTPAAPQAGTDQYDYKAAIGLVDTFMGPVQITAAQFAWGQLYAPQFVYDGLGSALYDVTDAGYTGNWKEISGGGITSYTAAFAPVPEDILRNGDGAVSAWVYVEKLYDSKNWLFNFKTATGGANALLGGGTVNDVFGAYIFRDGPAGFGTENTSLVVSVPDTTGSPVLSASFPLGWTTSQLEGRWLHVFIQWRNNQYRAIVDGVPIQPLGDPTGYVFRSPEIVVLGSVTEHRSGAGLSGLIEGFTVYDRFYTLEDIQSIYKGGDNLVTGAIAHASLHDGVVLEVGEAIGFEGPGDYRVAVDGYGPGTSVGQPTVRFQSGREATGPYIVQQKYPKILEPIQFEVMNTDRSQSVSQKLSKVNRVLQRSGTGQSLVLQYAPRGSQRNLRADVTHAFLNVPVEWTGVAQATEVLKGLSIDLERENFTGGSRSLGRVWLPEAFPLEQNSDEEYGTTVLPPVEGNLPAPLYVSALHRTDMFGQVLSASQPNSFFMAIRRRKSLDEALYVLSGRSLEPTMGTASFTTDVTVLDEGYVVVEQTDTPTVGTYYELGRWKEGNVGGIYGTNSKLAALGLVSNHGSYRAYLVARSTSDIAVVKLTIGDGSYEAQVSNTAWGLVDFGVVSIPGRSVERPLAVEWTPPQPTLSVQRLALANYQVDIAGIVFLPVDDGLLQLYSSQTGKFVSYAGPDGTFSNAGIIAAYSAGMVLSSSVQNELRGFTLQATGTPNLYSAWNLYHEGLRLHVEYMPTYTGLGDE